ncbi:hypothetical protein WKH44_23850, partial [Pantoea agglomerans]|uniref:hypothetical protein n=1 Tax=Enterobacter agglomerans TaxID=549 RepID=UPI003C7BEED5
PEEQSVHARDGVADPHGCGNPLRSGTAGLATAPDSQPPAISHQPSATSHQPSATSHQPPATSHPFSRPASKTSNNTPIPSKRHPNPNKKGLLCPKSKASTPGMAWPIRMDAGILCDRAQQALRRLPTHSHQPFSRPASHTSNTTPIPSKRHPNPNKKGLLCPKSKASTPGMAWPIR